MNFYDIPEDAFPQGAQFFHHVTVVSIAIADDAWIAILYGILKD